MSKVSALVKAAAKSRGKGTKKSLKEIAKYVKKNPAESSSESEATKVAKRPASKKLPTRPTRFSVKKRPSAKAGKTKNIDLDKVLGTGDEFNVGLSNDDSALERRDRNKQTFLTSHLNQMPQEIHALWEKSLKGGSGARALQTKLVNSGVIQKAGGKYAMNTDKNFISEIVEQTEKQYEGEENKGVIRPIMETMVGGKQNLEDCITQGLVSVTVQDGVEYFVHKTLVQNKGRELKTTRSVGRQCEIDDEAFQKLSDHFKSIDWSFDYSKKELKVVFKRYMTFPIVCTPTYYSVRGLWLLSLSYMRYIFGFLIRGRVCFLSSAYTVYAWILLSVLFVVPPTRMRHMIAFFWGRVFLFSVHAIHFWIFGLVFACFPLRACPTCLDFIFGVVFGFSRSHMPIFVSELRDGPCLLHSHTVARALCFWFCYWVSRASAPRT